MDWKETVMKESDCPYQPDGGKDELWADLGAVYHEKFMQGARNQAEISFKAGIREVVEWIEGNATDIFKDYLQCSSRWQDFKESKGVK